MAKKVELIITVDEEGIIHMESSGTSGDECLSLMNCISSIAGTTTLETKRTDDSKQKKVQIAGKQHIG